MMSSCRRRSATRAISSGLLNVWVQMTLPFIVIASSCSDVDRTVWWQLIRPSSLCHSVRSRPINDNETVLLYYTNAEFTNSQFPKEIAGSRADGRPSEVQGPGVMWFSGRPAASGQLQQRSRRQLWQQQAAGTRDRAGSRTHAQHR